MRQFSYRAVDQTGKRQAGLVESLDDKQAARTLQERGWLVVEVKQKKELNLSGLLPVWALPSNVSEQEVATLTRLLATMLATGLPLTEALSNLAMQNRGRYLAEVIHSLESDVRSGVAMSTAMARYPKVFNNLYVNLVRAGEASGKMGETLERLADTLESSLDFKNKVKGAMVYPVIVVTAMVGIGGFMITTIIPKIADVYRQFGADLPLPTKILVGLSVITSRYFIVVLILGTGLFFLYGALRRNKTSDYLLNNAAYRIPIFGAIQEQVMTTVLARTLGTLLGAGVAISEALRIVSGTMGNDCYRDGLEGVAVQVEKGLPLSLAMARNPVFPVMMSQLVAIGEETGTVDQSLMRLSRFYQDAAERQVKMLTTTMEPLMILLMGLMVGGLAVAVLLPMFNLVNVIH